VDNLGLFGMHFVDKLHSYIAITELRSGCRVHPEPGFPDLALAARFAEAIAHIDFSRPKKMAQKDRNNLSSKRTTALLRERAENDGRGGSNPR
jgi:hypothetical protein